MVGLCKRNEMNESGAIICKFIESTAEEGRARPVLSSASSFVPGKTNEVFTTSLAFFSNSYLSFLHAIDGERNETKQQQQNHDHQPSITAFVLCHSPTSSGGSQMMIPPTTTRRNPKRRNITRYRCAAAGRDSEFRAGRAWESNSDTPPRQTMTMTATKMTATMTTTMMIVMHPTTATTTTRKSLPPPSVRSTAGEEKR